MASSDVGGQCVMSGGRPDTARFNARYIIIGPVADGDEVFINHNAWISLIWPTIRVKVE